MEKISQILRDGKFVHNGIVWDVDFERVQTDKSNYVSSKTPINKLFGIGKNKEKIMVWPHEAEVYDPVEEPTVDPEQPEEPVVEEPVTEPEPPVVSETPFVEPIEPEVMQEPEPPAPTKKSRKSSV